PRPSRRITVSVMSPVKPAPMIGESRNWLMPLEYSAMRALLLFFFWTASKYALASPAVCVKLMTASIRTTTAAAAATYGRSGDPVGFVMKNDTRVTSTTTAFVPERYVKKMIAAQTMIIAKMARRLDTQAAAAPSATYRTFEFRYVLGAMKCGK